jgi:hypothetical protein
MFLRGIWRVSWVSKRRDKVRMEGEGGGEMGSLGIKQATSLHPKIAQINYMSTPKFFTHGFP